jgi:hypothetical protein
MERCAECGQPAMTFAYSGNPPKVSAAFCFVHSAVTKLGEQPPDWISTVAHETNLSPNAIFFLWTAFRSRPQVCRNALGCCLAVWQEASDRFGSEAGDALRLLGVRGGKEIDNVLKVLLRNGVERLAEDERPEDFSGLAAIGEFP